MEWERKAENAIRTANTKNLSTVVEERKSDLQIFINNLHEQLQSKMDEFFEGKHAEILIQWEKKFKIRLDGLSSDLKDQAKRRCEKLQKNSEAISAIESKKIEYAKTVTKRVMEHIATIKKEQETLNQNLDKKWLRLAQVEALLAMDLFTPEKLHLYKTHEIITPTQASQISAIVSISNNQLTQDDIKTIVVKGILSVDQVKRILKTKVQTEAQLKAKFDVIWNGLMANLPSAVESVNVAKEVESKLTDYVRTNRGKLVALLKKRSLIHVATLELQLKENFHYKNVTTGVFSRIITYVFEGKLVRSSPHHIDALNVTERVFGAAREYLEKIKKQMTVTLVQHLSKSSFTYLMKKLPKKQVLLKTD